MALPVKTAACILALLAAGLFTGGCATTGADQPDSDIPWNAPQSWEGAPGIPGLEAR
jgi:hypothetical protein